MDTASFYIIGGALLITLVFLFVFFHKFKHINKKLMMCEKRMKNMIGDQVDSKQPKNLLSNEKLYDFLDTLEYKLNTLSKELANETKNTSEILHSIHEGILIVNTSGQVTMLNRSAEELFNISHKNVIGLSFIAAVRDHEIDSIVKQCFNTGDRQERTVHIDNTKQSFHTTATPLDNGVLVIIQDITRIKHLENVRKEFISNISHELRTPIASLKAIVETLRDGALHDTEVADKFLSKTDIEIDKLAELVNELGELSTIESQGINLQFQLADLTTICRRVIERMMAQAEKKALSLYLHVPSFVPLIGCDENRLEQILVNLVHNAIKFTPKNGEIGISIVIENQSATISVTDNGIGISTDDLPHVFERFYKVDKARSSSGTGLGLAIAKHLVLAHGGTLWVESVEGKGSTFSFSIPVKNRTDESVKSTEEVQV